MSTHEDLETAKITRRDRQAAVAPGRKLRAQGQRTRELIIHEAKKLLLEGGSLEFTLRTVARRARITISNLQYYFPTRQTLLRAVLEPVVARFVQELKHAASDVTTAKERLAAIVDKGCEDPRDPETASLWLQFASLAVTDPECARLLHAWYAALSRKLGYLLHALKPSLGTRESRLLARIIIAMIDGLGFQIRGRPGSVAAGVEGRLRESVRVLLEQR